MWFLLTTTLWDFCLKSICFVFQPCTLCPNQNTVFPPSLWKSMIKTWLVPSLDLGHQNRFWLLNLLKSQPSRWTQQKSLCFREWCLELTGSYWEHSINSVESDTLNFLIIFQSVLSKLGDLEAFLSCGKHYYVLKKKKKQNTFAYIT